VIGKSDISYPIRIRKTALVMLGFSVFTFVFHKVYAHYSHGVDSASMQSMYLTLLVLGAIFYSVLGFIKPDITRLSGYRGFTNLYNMGLATVVTGQLIQGIVEVAGTGSKYIRFYYVVGTTAMCLGIFVLLLSFVIECKQIKSE